jgi:hypothetical protein
VEAGLSPLPVFGGSISEVADEAAEKLVIVFVGKGGGLFFGWKYVIL